MFFAIELQTSRVYISMHKQGLFKQSDQLIGQDCLRAEHGVFRYAAQP